MVRRTLLCSFVALVVLGLPSCTGSRSGGPSAGTIAHRRDAAAVKAAVSTYFGSALGSGDWQQVALDSSGQLQVQAGWLAAQDIAPSLSASGSLVVRRLEVTSIVGSRAVVAFDATRMAGDQLVTYGGPVSVVKAAGGWKIADYTRDGRSVAASTFTNVRGVAHVSHVTVRVVGVQLETGHVDVWVRIVNATSAHLTWDRPMVIVDASGEQLGHGSLFVSSSDTTDGFVMLPHVSVFGDFLIDNVTLPLGTRAFTLAVGATDERTNRVIDLQVPVRIGG